MDLPPRRLFAGAMLASGALLAGCAAHPQESSAPAEPEGSSSSSAETPQSPAGETSDGGPAASEEEFDRIQREPTPDEALILRDEPVPHTVPAPQEGSWPLHGSFDVDVPGEHFDATLHIPAGRC